MRFLFRAVSKHLLFTVQNYSSVDPFLNSLQVGICLYGINQFNRNRKLFNEETAILDCLISMINASTPKQRKYEHISSQALANTCYGLRNFSGKYSIDKALFKAVNKFFDTNHNHLIEMNERALSGICFFVKDLNLKIPEVKEFISTLCIYIKNSYKNSDGIESEIENQKSMLNHDRIEVNKPDVYEFVSEESIFAHNFCLSTGNVLDCTPTCNEYENVSDKYSLSNTGEDKLQERQCNEIENINGNQSFTTLSALSIDKILSSFSSWNGMNEEEFLFIEAILPYLEYNSVNNPVNLSNDCIARMCLCISHFDRKSISNKVSSNLSDGLAELSTFINRSKDKIINRLIRVVVNYLHNNQSQIPINLKAFSALCYSLANVRSGQEASVDEIAYVQLIVKYLDEMSKKLDETWKIADKQCLTNDQSKCNGIAGIDITSNVKESDSVIELINDSVYINDSHAIGSVIYGLKSNTATTSLEKKIINLVVNNINSYFYGVAPVLEFYNVNGDKLRTHSKYYDKSCRKRIPMTGNSLMYMLAGLSNMTGKSIAEKKLLRLITRILSYSKTNVKLTNRNIAYACQGIANLNPNKEKYDLLIELIAILENSPVKLFNAYELSLVQDSIFNYNGIDEKADDSNDTDYAASETERNIMKNFICQLNLRIINKRHMYKNNSVLSNVGTSVSENQLAGYNSCERGI